MLPAFLRRSIDAHAALGELQGAGDWQGKIPGIQGGPDARGEG